MYRRVFSVNPDRSALVNCSDFDRVIAVRICFDAVQTAETEVSYSAMNVIGKRLRLEGSPTIVVPMRGV